jgi:DNA gyrase/topoisomerase IV subunit B
MRRGYGHCDTITVDINEDGSTVEDNGVGKELQKRRSFQH